MTFQICWDWEHTSLVVDMTLNGLFLREDSMMLCLLCFLKKNKNIPKTNKNQTQF